MVTGSDQPRFVVLLKQHTPAVPQPPHRIIACCTCRVTRAGWRCALQHPTFQRLMIISPDLTDSIEVSSTVGSGVMLREPSRLTLPDACAGR